MDSRARSLSGRSSTRRMSALGSSVAAGGSTTGSAAITRASSIEDTSRYLAVDALAEVLVRGLVRREPDRLLRPQGQEAEADQALIEQPVHAVLEIPVEVDEDVAAQHDVELVEGSVGHQVVLREVDVAPQRPVEHRAVVHGGVEAGEGPAAAAAQVVRRVLGHRAQRHLA